MINEKAKKELTKQDYNVLSEILTKSPEVLTQEERAHLVARRGYLTKDTLKEYKIEGGEEAPVEPVTEEAPEAPEEVTPEEVPEEKEEETPDYNGLSKDELTKECKKRNIGINVKTTKGDMIELIEADDKGELEEVEEEGEK